MASTIWPISTSLESPNVAGFRVLASLSTRITARSSGANSPMTLAGSVLFPTESTTLTDVAVPMTCSLVTTSPLVSNTTPEPVESFVVICTTDGKTFRTTCSYADWSGAAEPFVRAFAPELPLEHPATANATRIGSASVDGRIVIPPDDESPTPLFCPPCL